MYILFEYIHMAEIHEGSLDGIAANMQVAIKEVSEHLDTHFKNWELVRITLDDLRGKYTPAERIGY